MLNLFNNWDKIIMWLVFRPWSLMHGQLKVLRVINVNLTGAEQPVRK